MDQIKLKLAEYVAKIPDETETPFTKINQSSNSEGEAEHSESSNEDNHYDRISQN